MTGVTRREFGRLLAGAAALTALGGCAPETRPAGTDGTQSSIGPASTPAGPTAVEVPPAVPARMLSNKNRDNFHVRFYKDFPAVDHARWILAVDGMVSKPLQLTLTEIQALPLVSQVSRMKCVECWSAPAKWGGFRYEALAALVEPKAEAKWVHFRCADGYYESLSIEELRMERVLFVHRMNDQPLEDDYGAPLKLIVPFKYGYKGPKTITHLTFADGQLKGYWPAVGGYSVNGNIQEGLDHPLDLPGSRRIDGDEVIYPDGIESRG